MKLEGLRVLDLGMYLPSPVITQLMVNHGADVICVEPPGGQPARTDGALGSGGEPLWFNAMHHGKRSIMLDLKQQQDRQVLLNLARQADVLIEGFRPGVAERLGIDAQTVRALNPRLVYCSLSAFGQTGPLSRNPGHDILAQACTGVLSLNGAPGQLPVNPAACTADMVGALTALSGILMALYRRDATGVGDYIDVALSDSLLAYTSHYLSFVLAERDCAQQNLASALSGYAFYTAYETGDGRALVLAAPEPPYVRRFLHETGREDLIEAALGPPGPEQDRVKRALSQLFKAHTLDHWRDLLDRICLPWSPLLSMAEAFDHPHARVREMVIEDDGDGLILGTPLKFQEEPGSIRRGAPHLDEHRDTILTKGFS